MAQDVNLTFSVQEQGAAETASQISAVGKAAEDATAKTSETSAATTSALTTSASEVQTAVQDATSATEKLGEAATATGTAIETSTANATKSAEDIGGAFSTSASSISEISNSANAAASSVQQLGQVGDSTAESLANVGASSDISAISTDSAAASRSLQEVSTSAEKAGESGQEAGQKLSEGMNSAASATDKVATSAAGAAKQLNQMQALQKVEAFKRISDGATFAAGKVAEYGKASLEAAAGDQEMVASLKVVTGSLERAQEAFDFASKQTTPWDMASVQQATFTMERYGLTTEKYLPIIGNLAAGTRKDIVSTADAVGKALSGISSGVTMLQRQFGIGAEELQKFGANVDASGSVMTKTQADIDALRGAIERLSTTKYGNALEERSQTASAQLQRIKDDIEMFEGAVGTTLLPLVASLTKALKGVTDWLNSLGPTSRTIIAVIGVVIVSITALIATIGQLTLWTTTCATVFEGFGTFLKVKFIGYLLSAKLSVLSLSEATIALTGAIAGWALAIGGILVVGKLAIDTQKQLAENARIADERMSSSGANFSKGKKEIEALRQSVGALNKDAKASNLGEALFKSIELYGDKAKLKLEQMGISIAKIKSVIGENQLRLKDYLNTYADLQEQIRTGKDLKGDALSTDELANMQVSAEKLKGRITDLKTEITETNKALKELEGPKNTGIEQTAAKTNESLEKSKKAAEENAAANKDNSKELEKQAKEQERIAQLAQREAEQKAKALASLKAINAATSAIQKAGGLLGGDNLEEELAGLDKAISYLRQILATHEQIKGNEQAKRQVAEELNKLYKERLSKLDEIAAAEKRAQEALKSAQQARDDAQLRELEAQEKTAANFLQIQELKKKRYNEELKEISEKYDLEYSKVQRNSKAYKDFKKAEKQEKENLLDSLNRELEKLRKEYLSNNQVETAKAEDKKATKTPEKPTTSPATSEKSEAPTQTEVKAATGDMSAFTGQINLANVGTKGFTASLLAASEMLKASTAGINSATASTASSLATFRGALAAASSAASSASSSSSGSSATSTTNSEKTSVTNNYTVNIDGEKASDSSGAAAMSKIAQDVINKDSYNKRTFGGF